MEYGVLGSMKIQRKDRTRGFNVYSMSMLMLITSYGKERKGEGVARHNRITCKEQGMIRRYTMNKE